VGGFFHVDRNLYKILNLNENATLGHPAGIEAAVNDSGAML
jgi:hypothetical protein